MEFFTMYLKSDNFRFSFYILLQIILSSYQIGGTLLSESEYILLPELVKVDPYDICKLKASTHRYCVSEVLFRPASNKTNHIWDLIQEMNRDQRNFRHDWAKRGRCLKRSEAPTEDTFNYFQQIYNDEFLKYDFTVYKIVGTVCDYFETQLDKYDVMAICILLAIMLLIFACTFIDLFIFRKHTIISRGCKYIQCFSLIKNWTRFQSMKESKDNLKFVQGIRFLSMSLIVFGHSVFLLIYGAAYNSYIFEEQYRKIVSSIIINGLVVVQTYFFLSGLFLGYAFFKIMFNYKFKFQYILLAILGRYNRLTPSFAILSMINATFLYHIGSGAFWAKNIGFDRENCRQNWWANLLYISNELKPDKMCMLNGWFISVDFQLCLFSLCLLTVIWFKREWALQILGISFIISLLIPGIITYIYQLDPLPLVYPEILKSFFANYDTFEISYLQPHMNASTYIFGLIVGYFFYTGDIAKLPSRHFLVIALLYTIAWLAALSILFGAFYFYTDYYVYNRIGAAIFAAVYKVIFVLTPVLIIWGSKTGLAQIFIRLLEWKPLVILGRLSFSIYLVHWPLIRVITSMDPITTYNGLFSVIALKFPAILTLSIISALILALFVEFPISGITNLLTDSAEELKDKSPVGVLNENNTKRNLPAQTDSIFVNSHMGKQNGSAINRFSVSETR